MGHAHSSIRRKRLLSSEDANANANANEANVEKMQERNQLFLNKLNRKKARKAEINMETVKSVKVIAEMSSRGRGL